MPRSGRGIEIYELCPEVAEVSRYVSYAQSGRGTKACEILTCRFMSVQPALAASQFGKSLEG